MRFSFSNDYGGVLLGIVASYFFRVKPWLLYIDYAVLEKY
jgi:hypothetical protein